MGTHARDHVLPVREPRSIAHARALAGALAMLFFTLLTALSAQVAIPMPPLGVPQTLHTLAVILAALCLGPRLGMASMGLYALVGAIGVPVFAGGNAGMATILGQTGGYILGFIACQPVVTSIVRRKDGSIRGWGALIAATLAGHGVIFALGVPWLYVVRNADPALEAITISQAVYGGFVVFIPGMLVKSALAVWIGRLAVPWAARRFW